jgi:hypothetical protein
MLHSASPKTTVVKSTPSPSQWVKGVLYIRVTHTAMPMEIVTIDHRMGGRGGGGAFLFCGAGKESDIIRKWRNLPPSLHPGHFMNHRLKKKEKPPKLALGGHSVKINIQPVIRFFVCLGSSVKQESPISLKSIHIHKDHVLPNWSQ